MILYQQKEIKLTPNPLAEEQRARSRKSPKSKGERRILMAIDSPGILRFWRNVWLNLVDERKLRRRWIIHDNYEEFTWKRSWEMLCERNHQTGISWISRFWFFERFNYKLFNFCCTQKKRTKRDYSRPFRLRTLSSFSMIRRSEQHGWSFGL